MYWKQTIEILKVVVVPRFVAYPYLDDPFYDIDNQDKYLLHNYTNELSISSDSGFPARLEVNYYSQFCKYVPFIHGSIDNDDQLLHSYNQQLFVSIFNIINLFKLQKNTYFQSPYISCLSSSINSSLAGLSSSYFLIGTSLISSCNILKDISSTLTFIEQLRSLKPFISNLLCMIPLMDATSSIGLLITNLQMLFSIMGDLSLIDVYLARLQYAKTYIETMNLYLSIITSEGLIHKIIENYVYIKHNLWEEIIYDQEQELNYTLSETVSTVGFMSGGRIKIKMPKALFTDIHILITNLESVIGRLKLLEEILKHLDLINQTNLYLEHLKNLIINLKILHNHINRLSFLFEFKQHIEIINEFKKHLEFIKNNVNTLREFKSYLNELINFVYVLNSIDTLASINKYIGNTKEIIKYLKKIQSTFSEVHDLVSSIKEEQTPESFLKILQSIKSNVGSLKNTQVLIKEFGGLMNGYIDSLKRSTESNKNSIELIRSILSVTESVGKVINYLESVEFIIKNYTVVQHVIMNFVSSISVIGRLKSFQVVKKSLQRIEIVIILLKYYRIILEVLQYTVSVIDVYKIDLIIEALKGEIELEEYKEDESLKITCLNGYGQTECIEEVQTSITMTTKEKITTIIREMTESFINLKGVINIFIYILAILPVKGYISMMGHLQSVKFFLANMLNIISISKDMELIYHNKSVFNLILGYNKISYLITLSIRDLRSLSRLSNVLGPYRSILGNIKNTTYNKVVLQRILSYISNLRTTINIDVTNLESSLETVLQKFMEKSLESTICNLKESKSGEKEKGTTSSIVTPKSNSNQYGNSWDLLSHSVVADSKFVITRLYGCTVDTNNTLYILRNVERCGCVLSYKWETDNLHRMYNIYENYPLVYSNTHKKFHIKSLMKDETNNLCLCLVIKFQLYPTLIRCLCRLIDTGLDVTSSLSRKFDKFNKSWTLDSHQSKLSLFFIEAVYKIFIVLEKKYLTHFFVEENRVFRCFCRFPKDSYYSYFISTMHFICFLVEDMFRGKYKDFEDRTQNFVTLLSDIKFIDSYCSKDPSKTPKNEKARHTQNYTCVELRHRKHPQGGIYYIMVRREKHPVRHRLRFSRLPGFRIKNQQIIGHRFLLSVSSMPFEGDKFGIVAEFPFVDIEKTNQQAKLLVGSGCVSSNNVKKSNELEHFKCHKHMIVGICLNMVSKDFDLIKMQISGNSILYMVLEPDYSSDESRMRQIVKTISEEGRKITIMSRNNRIVDSTNEISNELEGSSVNHYSYNDAYRINTSRAHGLFFQWKADCLSSSSNVLLLLNILLFSLKIQYKIRCPISFLQFWI